MITEADLDQRQSDDVVASEANNLQGAIEVLRWQPELSLLSPTNGFVH
jgi:hypothetical protein